MTRVGRPLLWLFALALVAAHIVWHRELHPEPLPPWSTLVEALTPQLAKLAVWARTLAALAAVDAAALVLGAPLLRLLGEPDDAWVRPIARLVVGLVALAWAVLALAALHLLVAPALAALVALPILVATPSLARRLARLRPPRPRRWWWALLFAVPPLVGAFVPSWGWDALTYHLALPERYLWSHRIWFSPLSLYSGFPLDGEMLYALALPLGGPALAKLVNVQCGALALLVVAAAARRHSPRAVPFALALPLADPLFHWELGVVYTDLMLTLVALLAVEALAAWDVGDARAIRRAALFGGVCVGVRYPGASVPLAMAVVIAAGARRYGTRRALAACVALGVGAVAMVAPWLVRNAVFAHNPFAPALQGLFGDYFDPFVVAEQAAFTHAIGYGHGPLALLALPFNLFVRSYIGAYTDSFGSPVGPLYLVGAVAALAVAEVRRDRPARLALATAGVLTLVWFVTAQEARYLLPALFLVAAPGGAALARLCEGRLARVGFGAVVLLALVWGEYPQLRGLPPRWAVALGGVSVENTELSDDAAWLAARLRETLPPDARVLLVLEPRGFFFRGLDYLPYHVLEGAPLLHWVHDAPDTRALRCRVATLGVTHLVVNQENVHVSHPLAVPGYGAADYLADLGRLRRFLQDWATPVAKRGGVVAAALRPVDNCPR